MPNCDFYATPEDHLGLLQWLFAEETCRVYELASVFGEPLRCFNSAEEVATASGWSARKQGTAALLQLYVLGAGPPFRARRIRLDPAACGGATFRYEADGWGLVQLYLEVPRRDQLRNSHTNHNSQTRAQTWAHTVSQLGDPAQWDFARITSFSSRLNREIRKRAVARIGSRPVLPGALKLWDANMSLVPYCPGEHAIERPRPSKRG
jgi:hypothetical protein